MMLPTLTMTDVYMPKINIVALEQATNEFVKNYKKNREERYREINKMKKKQFNVGY